MPLVISAVKLDFCIPGKISVVIASNGIHFQVLEVWTLENVEHRFELFGRWLGVNKRIQVIANCHNKICVVKAAWHSIAAHLVKRVKG